MSAVQYLIITCINQIDAPAVQRHDTGEKEQQSANVLPQQPVANATAAGTNVEISLDLAGTGEVDINYLLLKSPQEQKQETSSDEEWEDVDTGEPISETKVLYLDDWCMFAAYME